MLRIFIQDSLFNSQGELLSMRVLRRRSFSTFYSPFEYGSRSHNISSLENYLPGLSISLSSISIAIFQVFCIENISTKEIFFTLIWDCCVVKKKIRCYSWKSLIPLVFSLFDLIVQEGHFLLVLVFEGSQPLLAVLQFVDELLLDGDVGVQVVDIVLKLLFVLIDAGKRVEKKTIMKICTAMHWQGDGHSNIIF